MLQPGQKVEVYYNKGNIHNQVWHIRAIVDDEIIVYRVRNFQGWSYRIIQKQSFEYMYKKERLN
jgi:hypothetical protein